MHGTGAYSAKQKVDVMQCMNKELHDDYHTKFTGDYYKVLTAQDSLLDAVKAVAGSRWDDSVSVWIQGCA